VRKLITIDVQDADYIYYCSKDRSMILARLTREETKMSDSLGAPCPICNENMERIGWQAYRS
jgi:hypothetical protein